MESSSSARDTARPISNRLSESIGGEPIRRSGVPSVPSPSRRNEEGMSRRLTRPSPALVISIMALVVAIVVPAYAALTKKDKHQVKNIANTEITKRAPGLAVSSAKTAGNADLLDGQDSADIK